MLSKIEIDDIRERCKKANDGNPLVSIETLANIYDSLDDIPKLLSHIAQQEAEVERLDAEAWYWRLEYQQMKADYERTKTKAQRFYNERNYYKGYADRYSDVIKEKEVEVERLKRKLALIEDKADRTMDDGVDLVAVELLYEIYLHAKEDEEGTKTHVDHSIESEDERRFETLQSLGIIKGRR